MVGLLAGVAVGVFVAVPVYQTQVTKLKKNVDHWFNVSENYRKHIYEDELK